MLLNNSYSGRPQPAFRASPQRKSQHTPRNLRELRSTPARFRPPLSSAAPSPVHPPPPEASTVQPLLPAPDICGRLHHTHTPVGRPLSARQLAGPWESRDEPWEPARGRSHTLGSRQDSLTCAPEMGRRQRGTAFTRQMGQS